MRKKIDVDRAVPNQKWLGAHYGQEPGERPTEKVWKQRKEIISLATA